LAASNTLEAAWRASPEGARDAEDAVVEVPCAAGGLLNIAGDFARCQALLFDRGDDFVGDRVNLGDGAADRLDLAHGSGVWTPWTWAEISPVAVKAGLVSLFGANQAMTGGAVAD
jgi:hypothetical protein